MKRKLILGIVFLLVFNVIRGQNEISGIVLNETSKLPVEYVNIGIAGKNFGTVTDKNGIFNLLIESQYKNDSLLFSCIGYEPYSIKISDLQKDNNIYLKEKSFLLDEIVVSPRIFKERTLGITSKSKFATAGFANNKLGYELGVLMKVNKKAIIKKVNINIATCRYDTIFYRLNIYEEVNKNFENILREPIYINISREEILGGSLQIDLEERNILVNGNFLVTLEHIKELGDGGIWFCTGLKQKTYYRKTSQGNWETAPIGISLSVVADVEK